MIEIKVPSLPESVADATVLQWHKNVGDQVAVDDIIVELEPDKVVLEIPSLSDGVLGSITQQKGSVVTSDQVLATLQ